MHTKQQPCINEATAESHLACFKPDFVPDSTRISSRPHQAPLCAAVEPILSSAGMDSSHVSHHMFRDNRLLEQVRASSGSAWAHSQRSCSENSKRQIGMKGKVGSISGTLSRLQISSTRSKVLKIKAETANTPLNSRLDPQTIAEGLAPPL